MTDGPSRLALRSFAAMLALATACTSAESDDAGPVAAPADAIGASQVYVDPEPGEVRLRNIRQLTFGGNNAESYFSASGTQLVFQRQEVVDAGCDQQYVMNIDGSGMRRISNGLGRTTCGFFHDNDERVLYSSTHSHGPECPAAPDRSRGYVWPLSNMEIYSVRAADGGDVRQLTSNGAYNAEATVSRDGSRIIFTSTMNGDIDLYSMNVDGSDLRQVTTRVGYDGGAFFSPDGSQIVWRAMYPETAADSADYLSLLADRLVRPARVELWVANADGTNARQVTRLGGANFAPFWHPDGRRILFSSNYENPRGSEFDLFLINSDGTGLEKVTHFTDFDSFPMFSPDGTKLVWASNRHQAQPYETNLFIADWVEQP